MHILAVAQVEGESSQSRKFAPQGRSCHPKAIDDDCEANKEESARVNYIISLRRAESVFDEFRQVFTSRDAERCPLRWKCFQVKTSR